MTTYPAKIAAAIHGVMMEVGYVQKGGINKFHGYKYAGESDLLQVLRPAMLKHGLILIPSVVECRDIDAHGITILTMDYTLAHKDGDVWPDKVRVIGSGGDANKNGVGDKGAYKAMTGANKYLLFKLFQIETGDDPEVDGERGPGSVTTRDPIAEAKREMGGGPSQYEVDKAKRLANEAALARAAAKAPPFALEPQTPATIDAAWCTGPQAVEWFKALKADLKMCASASDVGEVQRTHHAELAALDAHHADRHAKAMDAINQRLDDVRA